MVDPAKKAQPIEKFLEEMGGRTTAIKGNKCIPEPLGCGQPLKDFDQWTELQKREYKISGLCNICQNRFFWGRV